MFKNIIIYLLMILSFISCTDNPNSPNEENNNNTTKNITLNELKSELNSVTDFTEQGYTFVFKDKFNNLSANNTIVNINVTGTGMQNVSDLMSSIAIHVFSVFITKYSMSFSYIDDTGTSNEKLTELILTIKSNDESKVIFAEDSKFISNVGITLKFIYAAQ
ncbi:hypothetical protein [Brachyspira pilosicoli]|uniref:Uncharacterized protein n=1 Tax=Brachyspira pilosicoli TaxID=52584 RepID=A0AAJ6KB92_BRAPL|nr:hypothetical protein [Brachyspira pilosicoli]WIH80651.1 hypothetical protein NEI04_07510 [Brachyspira pilosicoli]WIH89618.1 hypothetical protein NEI02_07870 [Brachyspira pilosicoli]WIH91913.1 hypothetical protein NEI01_07870 [Brachyspira pilosicoli]WIH94142.1 hypothetical protein NEH99_07550 [Brachyspira pilosicoli]